MLALALLAGSLIGAAVIAMLFTGGEIAKLKKDLTQLERGKLEVAHRLKEAENMKEASMGTRNLLTGLKREKKAQIKKLQTVLEELEELTSPERDIVTREAPDKKPIDFDEEE